MQKIIIDTNVFISALIQKSFPFLIIKEVFSNDQIQLCLSDELFSEYFDVLNRAKFSKYPDFVGNAQSLLADIESKAVRYATTEKINLINDLNDNRLLELAAISKANFIITGNTNDFTMVFYKKTKIVTPKEYWGRF